MESLIPTQDRYFPASAPPPTEGTATGIDWVGILKRYWLLVAACTAVGIGLGVLAYSKTAPTFQSRADVLVENQRSTTFSGELSLGFGTNEKTIDTHVLIIQSPLLIERAVKKLQISKYPRLRGENPVAAIRSCFEVEKEGNWSNVMLMTYTSADATECRDVLTAIVNEYHAFLTESSQDVGQETTKLIAEAKDVLMKQLQEKQLIYDAFRKRAPLIWKDGKGVNPHRERQMDVERKRSELMLVNSTLSAKLKNTLDALRAGGERRKAVYFEAVREIAPNEGKEITVESSERKYRAALTDEYVKLRTTERSLATRFGEGHPDLVEIRNRLESLRVDLGIEDTPLTNESGEYQAERSSEADYIAIYVNMLNDRLATGEEQVAELDRIYEQEQAKANSLQTYLIQDGELRKDIDATQRLFDAVVSRLEEINIVRDHGGDSIDVLAPPEMGMQVAPVIANNVILGCLLGGLLGCGLAVLLDRHAAVFRSPMEIKNALGVPVVGRIPVLSKNSSVLEEFSSMSPLLCTVHRDGTSLAEAYRAVRTSLFYSVAGNNDRIIQVTSPLPGDGKSTLTSNLAVTVAKSGKSVLLVDADFRKADPAQAVRSRWEWSRPCVRCSGCGFCERSNRSPLEFQICHSCRLPNERRTPRSC